MRRREPQEPASGLTEVPVKKGSMMRAQSRLYRWRVNGMKNMVP
jgi:hypothetical protein